MSKQELALHNFACAVLKDVAVQTHTNWEPLLKTVISEHLRKVAHAFLAEKHI